MTRVKQEATWPPLSPAHEIQFFQGAFFPELSHYVLKYWYSSPTNLPQFPMYITDNKVNDGRKSAILKFHQPNIFEGISRTETTHFILY